MGNDCSANRRIKSKTQYARGCPWRLEAGVRRLYGNRLGLLRRRLGLAVEVRIVGRDAAQFDLTGKGNY